MSFAIRTDTSCSARSYTRISFEGGNLERSRSRRPLVLGASFSLGEFVSMIVV